MYQKKDSAISKPWWLKCIGLQRDALMWRRPAKWASFYHHPHRLSNFCGHLWIFVWKVYLAAVDSYVVSHCSTWNSTSNIRFKIFQVFGLFAITMCCFQCCRYSNLHHLVVDLCLPAFPKRGVDPSIHDRSRNEWATVGITKSFLATWIFFSFVFFFVQKGQGFCVEKTEPKGHQIAHSEWSKE